MANNYFDFIGQNAGEEKKEAPQQTQAMANVTVRCDADCFLLCDGEYLDIQLGAGKMAKIQVPIGQHLLEFLYTEDPDIKIEKEVDFPESGKSYLVIIKGLKDLVDGANAEAQAKAAEEEKAKLLRSIDFTKKYLVIGRKDIGFRNDLNASQIRSAIDNEIEPAAKMGIASAEMVMYIIYVDGVTGLTSEDMAMPYLKSAAEKGYDIAQFNLGKCYYHGRGTTKNLAEAFKWYKKAAEQGYYKAQNNLGYCYYYGWGTTKNLEEAVKWYKKSAEQGNDIAQCNLGYCYANGNGVERDEVEAVKWYRKAAEQGNVIAQSNLGNCYYYGSGTTKNLEEAEKWLEKAAKNGNEDAKKLLLKVRAER